MFTVKWEMFNTIAEHFIMYALTSSDGYIKGKHLVTQTVLM